MEKYIIILVLLASIFYIQNKLKETEGFEGTTQSLGGVDDTNAINTLAQIAKNLMAGGVTIPGNINIQGDLIFPNQTTIRGAGRLHITGEELLYILNKRGVMIGKEWGGTGDLTVQGNTNIGGYVGIGGNTNLAGLATPLQFIRGTASPDNTKIQWGDGTGWRLRFQKDDSRPTMDVYDNGSVNITRSLIVGGRDILAELDDLRNNVVRKDQRFLINVDTRRNGDRCCYVGQNLIVHGDGKVASWHEPTQQTIFRFLQV